MPFFKVTPHALLIEAADAQQAAMNAYRVFEDRTPNQFEVLGPDAEINHVALTNKQQDDAITIGFGKR